jgi:ABC-type phosphate transport system substrate-binding protein
MKLHYTAALVLVGCYLLMLSSCASTPKAAGAPTSAGAATPTPAMAPAPSRGGYGR